MQRSSLVHRSRSRGAFLLLCVVGSVLFAGCSSVEERQARALHVVGGAVETATGAVAGATAQVEEAAQAGWNLIAAFRAGIENIKRRVHRVQEGFGKIQEGKYLIEEGLKTGEGER